MKPCKGCEYRSDDDPNYCMLEVIADIPFGEGMRIVGDSFDKEDIQYADLPERCMMIDLYLEEAEKVFDAAVEKGQKLELASYRHNVELIGKLLEAVEMAINRQIEVAANHDADDEEVH